MELEEKLIQEIENRKTYFKTDSYSMSIGELKNLYENKEIVIRPEYQRLFRWTQGQKVKLIESILIGIPIPSIFVYQNKDGVWELVDGLQRISTILQCMGVLEGEEELILNGTKYIPSLEGFSWNNADEKLRIPEALKLAIRRSKLNLTIILSESDSKAKFEVFQRLNTGGSNASNQEIRNNIMIMIDPDRFHWFEEMSKNADFLSTLSLSERLSDEQYQMELLLRFIALSQFEYDNKRDVGDFLDDVNEKLLEENNQLDFDKITDVFNRTFKLINDTLGDRAFKKDQKGKFLESGFEAIAIGIASNIKDYTEGDIDFLRSKMIDLYSQDFYLSNAGSGSNAKSRINKLVPAAKEFFKK